MQRAQRFLIVSALVAGLALQALPAAAAIRIAGLNPQPGSEVELGRPPISFDLEASSRVDLDASDIHVDVDGHDVSDQIDIDGSHVTYVPLQPLARGSHTVRVAVDQPGGTRASDAWSFVVTVSEPQIDNEMQPAGDGDAPIAFYPAISAPSYAPGTSVRFIVTGPYGGHGYLVFPGLSGTYPLVPYAPGFYYVVVFIPIGYATPNPPVSCHFFAPGRRAQTVPLDRQIAIRPSAAPPAPGSAHAPAYVMSAPQPATASTTLRAFTGSAAPAVVVQQTPAVEPFAVPDPPAAANGSAEFHETIVVHGARAMPVVEPAGAEPRNPEPRNPEPRAPESRSAGERPPEARVPARPPARSAPAPATGARAQ
jgi:hypothetical protein